MPAAKFEITRQCKVCGETFVAKPLNRGIALPNVPRLRGKGVRMKNRDCKGWTKWLRRYPSPKSISQFLKHTLCLA